MNITALKNKFIYISVVVTAALTMFAGMEVSARILKWIVTAKLQPEPESAGEIMSQKYPWSNQYEHDAAGESERHMIYVEFREKPYASETVNIDNEGRRVVPGNCEHDGALTLLTFGGSTMFGSGVPDEFTIPAYLTGILQRTRHCVRIFNYGSSWWQSSQAVIQLIEVLKQGIRPHSVIFYDGINETNAVSFGGKPGGIDPGAEERMKNALEPDSRNVWDVIADNLLVVRVLKRKLFPQPVKSPENEYEVPAAEQTAYATALADVYATNVRTVTALSKEYGFAAYFFLQPSPWIAHKKNTELEEAAFSAREKGRQWERGFFRLSYDAFKSNAYLAQHPNFFDISEAFDGLTQELYWDTEHLQPEGNRIVAERIARVLEPHL